MPRSIIACALILLWSNLVPAQDVVGVDEEAVAKRWADLTLLPASTPKFQRFVEMAASGALGKGVVRANVGIWKNHARLELIGADDSRQHALLSAKRWSSTPSRCFEIEPDVGSPAVDVTAIGRALDEQFAENPFELIGSFFDPDPGTDPPPSALAAWRCDGWRGVRQAWARAIARPVPLPHATAAIIALGMAAAAILVLLWRSPTH